MPYQVTKFESTPNPNAMKCWLDHPISEEPRSFLNREMAKEDLLALNLFDKAQATCVLFHGEWLTVNKLPEQDWPPVKRRIREVLAQERP